ncbi:hypothetical protein [Actinomadura harenae]|uniref:Uncharacterized protein n=1 Tax=Actinomadura harenae TaxID=2483351 RepID=A0A3M2M6T4_9ACTN|nr:hypothetical protein [Actinomadura harenae]RMI45306.1 hypothetical protein EBO15_10290 [Actinomadura harenae]
MMTSTRWTDTAARALPARAAVSAASMQIVPSSGQALHVALTAAALTALAAALVMAASSGCARLMASMRVPENWRDHPRQSAARRWGWAVTLWHVAAVLCTLCVLVGVWS